MALTVNEYKNAAYSDAEVIEIIKKAPQELHREMYDFIISLAEMEANPDETTRALDETAWFGMIDTETDDEHNVKRYLCSVKNAMLTTIDRWFYSTLKRPEAIMILNGALTLAKYTNNFYGLVIDAPGGKESMRRFAAKWNDAQGLREGDEEYIDDKTLPSIDI